MIDAQLETRLRALESRDDDREALRRRLDTALTRASEAEATAQRLREERDHYRSLHHSPRAPGLPPEVPHCAVSNIDGWHLLLVCGNDHIYLGERRSEADIRDISQRLDKFLAAHWPSPSPAVEERIDAAVWEALGAVGDICAAVELEEPSEYAPGAREVLRRVAHLRRTRAPKPAGEKTEVTPCADAASQRSAEEPSPAGRPGDASAAIPMCPHCVGDPPAFMVERGATGPWLCKCGRSGRVSDDYFRMPTVEREWPGGVRTVQDADGFRVVTPAGPEAGGAWVYGDTDKMFLVTRAGWMRVRSGDRVQRNDSAGKGA